MLSRYPLRSSNHSKQLSEIGTVDLPENGSHADKVCLSVADARCAGGCCQCVGSTRTFPAARRPLHECDTESLLEPTQRLTHRRPLTRSRFPAERNPLVSATATNTAIPSRSSAI